MALKIVFFGSDDFAVAHLKRLLESSHKVLACVTQPDRAKGRRLQLSATEVKDFALKNKLNILQPKDLKTKDFVKELKNLKADLFVVVAYGNFLPSDLLEIPKIFCVNIHASLLPKYRGAAPINWAIIQGEEKTGVTVFKLGKKIDGGEIINQKEMAILPDDTAITLRSKLMSLGQDLLIETLGAIEKENYKLIKQDAKKVNHAPKLKRDDGLIKWNRKARDLHNLVRGLLPWPGAFCHYQGKRLKILQTRLTHVSDRTFKPGQIMQIQAEGFIVATASQGLLITYVHLESSKQMDAKSFMIGHRLDIGSFLK